MRIKETGYIHVGRDTTVASLIHELKEIPQDALFEYEETLYVYRWRERTPEEEAELAESKRASLTATIEAHERLATKARKELECLANTLG